MRRSLGQKLVASFLFLALLMAAIGVFSVYGLNQLNKSTNNILRQQQPVLTAMAEIESATLFHSLKISQYVSTGNKAHLRTVDLLRDQVQTRLTDLEGYTIGTSDEATEAAVRDIREAYQTYRTLSDDLLTFYQANPTDTAGAAGRQLRIAAILENGVLANAETLYTRAQGETDDLINANEALYTDHRNLIIFSSILLTLLGIGFGIIISRSIVTPISALITNTRKVAAGDLAARATIRSRDELAELAHAFNTMTAQLQDLISTLEQRVAERTGALSDALRIQEQQAEELRVSLETQRLLSDTINELSVPIIPVRRDVMIVPLVGAIDSTRANLLLHNVLRSLEYNQTRVVILDVTGVAVVDTTVAHALLQTAQAIRLLGAVPVLAGIRPEVAQTLISLGLDLSALVTVATLEVALQVGSNHTSKRQAPVHKRIGAV